MMTTKDKTILLFLINKVKTLNTEIELLKAERELLLETAKKSLHKKPFLRLVN